MHTRFATKSRILQAYKKLRKELVVIVMKIDFSKIAFDDNGQAEQPDIVLCTPSMQEIKCISQAYKVSCKLCFNDISSFEFTVPYMDESYAEIKGRKLVRIDPYGYFRLEKPEETDNGEERFKECIAYSLETELNDKKVSDYTGSFAFYDPTHPYDTDTIMGKINQLAPSWKIGTVDSELFSKVRYFDITEQNLYNWMIQDVQKTYSCIFVFDTYTRTINVRDVSNLGKHSSVYLSKENVVSSLKITELSDETVTCLEVYGADMDTSIRRVNPRGDAYIYNYDYYMTEEWFPGEEKIKIIDGEIPNNVTDINGNEVKLDESQTYFARKAVYNGNALDMTYIKYNGRIWENVTPTRADKGLINLWYDYKRDYDRYAQEYINYQTISISYNSKLTVCQNELTDLENLILIEEKALEECIEQGMDGIKYEQYAEHYHNIYGGGTSDKNYNQAVLDKQAELEEIKEVIDRIDGNLADINSKMRFEKYFSAEQLKMLDNITVVDTLKDDSFVFSDNTFVGGSDLSRKIAASAEHENVISMDYESLQRITVDDAAVITADMDYLKISNATVNLGTADMSAVISVDDGVLSFSRLDDMKFDFCGTFINARFSVYDESDIKISGDTAGVITDENGADVEMDINSEYWAIKVTDGEDIYENVKIKYNADSEQWEESYDNYRNGTLSISGIYSEEKNENARQELIIESGMMFVTRSATAADKINVSKKLYDYAVNDIFPTICVPSYEFTADADNFIFLQQFDEFRRTMEFGGCVCVEKPNGEIIYPLLLEVDMDFDDRSNFEIKFSNKLKVGDEEYNLEQLFEDSLVGANTVSYERGKYASFSKTGAKTELYSFINSALNASKNKIINSSEQSFVMDSNGLKGRRVGESGEFENEQLWISNNQIVFTDDNWKSAKSALGKIPYGNSDGYLYGLVADAIIGKIIAGEKLIIESEATDGSGTAQFKVDGSGVTLNNASIALTKDGTDIVLNPSCGIGIGSNMYSYDEHGRMVLNYNESTGKWNAGADVIFTVDNEGSAYFKGKIEATGGSFDGDIRARDLFLGDSEISVLTTVSEAEAAAEQIQECFLNLKGMEVKNTETGETSFRITNEGNVYISGDIKMKSGSINWDTTDTPVKALYASVQLPDPTSIYNAYPESSSTDWHRKFRKGDVYVSYSYTGGTTWSTAIRFVGEDGAPGTSASLPDYIKETYIDSVFVSAPIINGGMLSSQTSINVGTDAVIGSSIYIGADENIFESQNTFSNGVFWGGASFIEKSDGAGNTYQVFQKNTILAGMQFYNNTATVEVGNVVFKGPAFIMSGVGDLYLCSEKEGTAVSGGTLKRVLTTADKLVTVFA